MIAVSRIQLTTRMLHHCFGVFQSRAYCARAIALSLAIDQQ
jgi:hypothetical protein